MVHPVADDSPVLYRVEDVPELPAGVLVRRTAPGKTQGFDPYRGDQRVRDELLIRIRPPASLGRALELPVSAVALIAWDGIVLWLVWLLVGGSFSLGLLAATALFGSIGWLLTRSFMQVWLNEARVVVHREELRAYVTPLPDGPTRRYLASAITRVWAEARDHEAEDEKRWTDYSLMVQTQDGEPNELLSGLETEAAAKWMAAQIEDCLGLRERGA